MGFQQITLNTNNFTTQQFSGTDSYAISGISDIENQSSATTITNNDNAFIFKHTFDEPQYINRIILNMGTNTANTCILVVKDINGNSTTVDTYSPGTGEVAKDINQPEINPIKYKSFQYTFISSTNSSTTVIDYINVFIPDNIDGYSFKDYNVEFDDALLDLAGWKNSRYNGSSLRGTRINTFTEGDISYGLNPVIESKTACIFLGKDIDVGKAANKDNPLTEILDHSYVTIDKILFIDLDTDEIEIVARENLNSQAFNRIVAENFPEGSTLVFKSLEKEANKLKNRHFVKFNQGQLMKLYSYQPNSSGFEDGVFGGINLHEGKGSTDAISLSGSGLFGFGQTVSSSHSLFNTSSIQFSSILPAELSFYAADYATETMGSSLANLTASSAPTLTAGSSINPDDFQEAFNFDDK